MKLWQITAHTFHAWIIINNGIVMKASPVIKWMVGETEYFVRTHCKERKWRIYD